jgi:hypothetical protein
MIRSVSGATVRRALRDKGFRDPVHGSGRDHEMFFLHVDDKKTAFFVKLSRGANELRVDEIKNNARNVGVLGDELYRIVCCEYNAQQTLAVYGRSSHRRPPP